MKRAEPRNPEGIKHLREHLWTLMEERKLLPADLAAIAKIPLSSLTRILNAEIHNPGIDVVISLATALKVTVSELLGDATVVRDGATFLIEGEDRIGLLHDISGTISAEKINIASSLTKTTHSTTSGKRARFVIHVSENSPIRLEGVAQQILQVHSCDFAKVLYPQEASTTVLMTEIAKFLNAKSQPHAKGVSVALLPDKG